MAQSAAAPTILDLSTKARALSRFPALARSVAFVAVLGATAVAMGCGPSPELKGGARGAPQPGTCGGAEAAVSGPEHAAGRSRLVGFLAASLDDVDLRPDQQATTQAILAALDAKTGPSRAAQRRIAAGIADEITAGTLTRERLGARLAELAKVDEATAAALDGAANRLHAALDAKQRKQFMRAMRANWRHAADLGGHGKHDKAKERALLDDLDLTHDQKHAVRAKVKGELKGSRSEIRERQHAARDRIREAARAFRSDQFDASAHALGRESLATRRVGLAVRLRIAAAALPELSPAQREKVAAYIRSQADKLD